MISKYFPLDHPIVRFNYFHQNMQMNISNIFILNKTSGQPVLRTECLGGVNPPRSTKVFSHKSESWLDPLHTDHPSTPPQDQQRWSPFHVKVDLILSVLIIDFSPPPTRINRGDHLYMRKWKLTVDPQHVDHWSPPRINRGDCVDSWSPPRRLSIDPPIFLIFNIRIIRGTK